MFPGGPNPSKVQLLPPAKAANPPLPLVLLHDGGGTTFGYFILGGLNRTVWAIHDPRYWEGRPWEGGMDEMARHYIGLMAEAGIRGPVMLGGWSLGGFLSLTIARFLADDSTTNITVAGILLMDSPFHIARAKITEPISEAKTNKVPDLVQKSFDNCNNMLHHWDLPSWDAPATSTHEVKMAVGGKDFTVSPSKKLYKPLREDWRLIDTETYQQEQIGNARQSPQSPQSPPPAVLIRCTKPTPSRSESSHPCLIDLFRAEPLLGWAGRYPDFIKAAIDVEADHYGIFDQFDNARMTDLTARVNEGLEILDGIHGPTRRWLRRGP